MNLLLAGFLMLWLPMILFMGYVGYNILREIAQEQGTWGVVVALCVILWLATSFALIAYGAIHEQQPVTQTVSVENE